MLLDGCLYIYSELDPESSARGKEGNINSDSLFLEENTRYTISIPNAQDMCAWNLNKKLGACFFILVDHTDGEKSSFEVDDQVWSSSTAIEHNLAALLGNVTALRWSVSISSCYVLMFILSLCPPKNRQKDKKKVVLEILKKIWSPRYLQTPSWDTSISSPRQRRRRKGPD